MHRSHYPKLYSAGGRPVNYCGIRCSLEVLGGKWKLLLLTLIADKPLRYSELRRAIPDVSEKMLISSLQEMEYHSLIERKVLEAVPPQVEYTLSDYGRTALPLVKMLYDWGEGHIATHAEKIFFPIRQPMLASPMLSDKDAD